MGRKILAVLFLVHYVSANDYYWRDYDHQIPSDAFIAGQDANHVNVYVGQTNILGYAGVHPVMISWGKEVWAIAEGPKNASNFVQILCSGNPSGFQWVPTTSTDIGFVYAHIVPGGVDQNHQTYIGRVKYQGNDVIGKVYTHDISNSDMVFVFNKQEIRATTYEILTYT